MPGLLTSIAIKGQVVLVVGQTNLTKSRVRILLDHGAVPIVVTGDPNDDWFDDDLEGVTVLRKPIEETDLTSLGRDEVDGVVDAVFVTLPPSMLEVSATIYRQCRRLRIPINVVDQPALCTFTLLSTHRDGDFQVGVTTSGKGCRLANRIKRHIVNNLPGNMNDICERVGALRETIQREDFASSMHDELVTGHDDDAEQTHRFNDHVSEYNPTPEQMRKRRLRWLTQIVEYYPLHKLAEVDINQFVEQASNGSGPDSEINGNEDHTTALANGAETNGHRKGKISLVGAGPGSTDLLTTGAIQAINSADIILADKLVPEPVLNLIPRTTPVHIAKKFPGNAEKAQQELLELGLQGVEQGKHVVRLKQGDPYIFGRGAEEYKFFVSKGYKPEVIAGITSALSAPLLANIPPTHREVADQVLFCTGTGRKGALPNFPEWVPTRTTVFLMALHRIESVVEALSAKGWDVTVPCAVIERSSCPDQRIIRTTLEHVAEAIEAVGSRPPGLLVVGYACEVIESTDEKWTVQEGL
uniref:ARAD1B14674p n=1 Tax=Blastobotrys adeninivorans TaxID=409370 RepID=A0A060T6B5_BLAAD